MSSTFNLPTEIEMYDFLHFTKRLVKSQFAHYLKDLLYISCSLPSPKQIPTKVGASPIFRLFYERD